MLEKNYKLPVLAAVLLINTLLLVFLLGKVFEMNQAEIQVNAETVQNILEIETVEEYIDFAESVSEGLDYVNHTVVLRSDLDFSGIKGVPTIGDTERNSFFYGVFDGGGHAIKNLEMDIPEGNAGLFAYLTGTVKNLIIRDCTFRGELAGAICADSHDASILNCYIDAEVEGDTYGTIAGSLRGKIYNCVAAAEPYAGTIQSGEIRDCFTVGTQDYQVLNSNLSWISGYADSTAFYPWDESGNPVFQENYADLLAVLTAKLEIDGRSVSIHAYYSDLDKTWGITLPSAYYDAKLTLTAQMTGGGFERFYRKSGESEMIFTWGERYYPIRFLDSDGVDSIFVTLEGQKGISYIHENKNAENTGLLTIADSAGNITYEPIEAFCGRGNDSWSAPKKGYKLEFYNPTALLGMEESDHYALLAGYRSDSLMNYVSTTELIKEVGFEYAPDYRLVNLYIGGEYVGIYFLAEKVELSENRIDQPSIYRETLALNHGDLSNAEFDSWEDSKTQAAKYYYHVEKNPEDLTGTYLLERDLMDYLPEESRFTTTRGVTMVMARAMYSSKEQVAYISDYWQQFEDAVLSKDGINDLGKHFSEYIDMESFAMQWLSYELVREVSMGSSIYYYKESEIDGDGLLHACFPWDMEYSYIWDDHMDTLWNVTEKAGIVVGYWDALYEHPEFQKELSRVWEEKFVPAIEVMTSEEAVVTENGTKNLQWHEEHLETIDRLENHRWSNRKPLEKCRSNREFLKVRQEILSKLLSR